MADTVINTAIYKIEIDTSGAKAALNDFDKTLESNGKKVEQKSSLASRAFNKAWQMAAGGAKSSIVKAFSAVTDQIIGFPKQILNVGAGFEQSMANVSAIMGATGDDLDKLSEKARDWGQNSKFSATEVADGFGYMAMAGWDTQQALDGIDAVLQLAVAGGTDLATTSDIVTDALTAFGYKASDAGKFADVLAAASSSANTNVSLMGESFKYAAPVAGALGYSVEDTAKAIGLMANAGIKGSEAGTALRTILTNMASPTDDMAYAMERLGASISDENGNMKSLGTIMEDLRSGFGELMIPEEEFHKRRKTLYRKRKSMIYCLFNSLPMRSSISSTFLLRNLVIFAFCLDILRPIASSNVCRNCCLYGALRSILACLTAFLCLIFASREVFLLRLAIFSPRYTPKTMSNKLLISNIITHRSTF